MFICLVPRVGRRHRRQRRLRWSAPFDLACNPVGPRGLTDVIHRRGVRRDCNPAYTYLARHVWECVCVHAVADMSLYPWSMVEQLGGKRRGGGRKGGVNLGDRDERRNGTTFVVLESS